MKWYEHLASFNIDSTLFVNEPKKPTFHKAIRVVLPKEKEGIQYFEMAGNDNGIAFRDDFSCYSKIEFLESWKYEKAYKGIVLKENGTVLPCGCRLLVIDLDMKDKPDKEITFTDAERKEYLKQTRKIFGISGNYSEQEITGNKGIHIFVKVKPELLNFGYGKINLGKAEIEIFTRSRGVITSPSESYSFWRKDQNKQYLQPENLIELQELPEGIEEKVIRTRDVSEDEAADEYKALYRKIISGDTRTLGSLRVEFRENQIYLRRYSTGTYIKLFRMQDGNLKIDCVLLGGRKSEERAWTKEYIRL